MQIEKINIKVMKTLEILIEIEKGYIQIEMYISYILVRMKGLEPPRR